MSEALKPEATAVAELVERLVQHRIVPLDSTRNALLVPKGMDLKSVKTLLDEYKTKPERIVGTAKHTTLESFIEHVARFADKSSALFADPTPEHPTLMAVLDYHPEVDDATGVAAAEARFGQHRSLYTFPVADEWKTWTEHDGDKMGQGAFAEFLENHIHNVTDPLSALPDVVPIMESLLCKFVAPSGLMELARGLTVRVNSIVANAQKLGSGEATLRYDTQHLDEAGAPLQVPGAFLLSIPVFRGGDRYQIAARLRYRVEGSKVTWLYQLHRSDETLAHVFKLACERAKAETKLPLFQGTPEV